MFEEDTYKEDWIEFFKEEKNPEFTLPQICHWIMSLRSKSIISFIVRMRNKYFPTQS